MNIGKKTSWQIAAVVAAALFAGGVQAHDRDSGRHGQRQQARHHDRHDSRDSRHHSRHHDDRYDRRHSRGQYYDRYDARRRDSGYYGREYGYQNRQLIDELERLAPPFSPPWLLRHGLLPR